MFFAYHARFAIEIYVRAFSIPCPITIKSKIFIYLFFFWLPCYGWVTTEISRVSGFLTTHGLGLQRHSGQPSGPITNPNSQKIKQNAHNSGTIAKNEAIHSSVCAWLNLASLTSKLSYFTRGVPAPQRKKNTSKGAVIQLFLIQPPYFALYRIPSIRLQWSARCVL